MNPVVNPESLWELWYPLVVGRSLFHKVFGIASSIVLLGAASSSLNASAAVAVLASFSTIQLAMPLSGFGLGQRLAGQKIDESLGQPSYLLRFLILAVAVAGVIALQIFQLGLLAVAAFSAVALLAATAELYRARSGRQDGFVALNLVRFAVAAEILWANTVGIGSLILTLTGLLVILFKGQLFDGWSEFGELRSGDFVRATHVVLVNQFYPFIALVASLVGYSGALALLAIHRSNIILNWQTFLWLRVANKQALDLSDRERRTTDKRIGRLNFSTALAVGLLAVLWETSVYGRSLSTVFDFGEHFQVGLLSYAVIVLLENLLIPPYESVNLYKMSTGEEKKLLARGAGLFLVIVIPPLVLDLPVIVSIIAAELAWVSIRLLSRRESQAMVEVQL